jgi:hypothetical protein
MTSYPATYANIGPALATLFRDKIANQIMRATVLLKLLPVLPVVGQNVTWDAEVLPSGVSPTVNAGVIADGAAVTNYSNDTYAPATLALGIYNDAIQVSGLAIAAAGNTKNPADLENLFGRKILEASRRVALSINNDLFTGSTSGGIVGLTGALLASGTYANVAISTYPSWASNLILNGGTPRPLTITLMRSMVQEIYQSSGMHPDLIVCNPAQFNEYGLLTQPQRFLSQNVNLRNQTIELDAGFNFLMFDNVPVVQDNSCPAGQMFFLSTSEIEVRVMPTMTPEEYDFETGTLGIEGDPEYQFGDGKTPITCKINELALAGDAFPLQLITYLQLACTRPNSCGILGDLS